MGQTQLAECRVDALEESHGLSGLYLRFCAANLGQLEGCIARQDLVSVTKIAHTLSGNAGRIGLSELSSLGRQMEEYCLGKDWGAIDSTYRAIFDTVSKLCDGQRLSIPIAAESARPVQGFTISSEGKG